MKKVIILFSAVAYLLIVSPVHSKNISYKIDSVYDYRKTCGAEDSDLYLYLNLSAEEVINPNINFEIYARYNRDFGKFDNDNSLPGYYQLRGIEDIATDRGELRLYHAYADIKDIGKYNIQSIKAGRFYYYGIERVYIDGIQVNGRINENIGITYYGGLPVNYYSGSSDRKLHGLNLSLNPAAFTLFNLEYIYYDEANFDQTAVYAVKNMTQVYSDLKVNIEYSRINDKDYDQSKDIKTEIHYSSGKNYTVLTFSKEFPRNKDYSNYFTLFNSFMGSNRASIFAGISYQRVLTKKHSLILEYENHSLSGKTKADRWNNEYDRFAAGVTGENVKCPLTGIEGSFDIFAELFKDKNDAEKSLTLTGSVNTQIKKVLVTAGTSFSRYEYDYLNDIDKENVKEYFINGKIDLNDSIKGSLKFNYEDAELTESLTKIVFKLMYTY